MGECILIFISHFNGWVWVKHIQSSTTLVLQQVYCSFTVYSILGESLVPTVGRSVLTVGVLFGVEQSIGGFFVGERDRHDWGEGACLMEVRGVWEHSQGRRNGEVRVYSGVEKRGPYWGHWGKVFEGRLWWLLLLLLQVLLLEDLSTQVGADGVEVLHLLSVRVTHLVDGGFKVSMSRHYLFTTS